MNGLTPRLQRFPHFLYLLPLFFVFHGYVQNKASVTVADAAGMLGEYLLAGLVLFLFGFLLYRNRTKAALFSFTLLAFHLFFGAVHDALKWITPEFFLAKYSVLLPLSLIGFTTLFFYLRKTKRSFRQLFLYLNFLFLVLLLVDVPSLFAKRKEASVSTSLTSCADCDKPDIFLLIADEYPDSLSLSNGFGFNNGPFLDSLRQRGFFIPAESAANYNFTAYSVAALFSMDYVQNIKGVKTNREDLNICYGKINENAFLDFLQNSGYEIRNHSIFNLANQPTKVQQHYILIGRDLVASQTFTHRLRRDVGYHLVTTLKLDWAINNLIYYTKRCNDKLLSHFREELERKPGQPRFVYTHLLMPHFPYYFDKGGNARPSSQLDEKDMYNKQAFLEYLQYSNGIYLNMIDEILKKAARPPVILFLSDHGFRWFNPDISRESSLSYRNLNAVFMPDKNYSPFYPGISLVNEFRVLLNTRFGQSLPLLKDTSYFIYE